MSLNQQIKGKSIFSYLQVFVLNILILICLFGFYFGYFLLIK